MQEIHLKEQQKIQEMFKALDQERQAFLDALAKAQEEEAAAAAAAAGGSGKKKDKKKKDKA